MLGGGLVVGSMVLIGGEPGIGKSTLTLRHYYLRPQGALCKWRGESTTN